MNSAVKNLPIKASELRTGHSVPPPGMRLPYGLVLRSQAREIDLGLLKTPLLLDKEPRFRKGSSPEPLDPRPQP